MSAKHTKGRLSAVKWDIVHAEHGRDPGTEARFLVIVTAETVGDHNGMWRGISSEEAKANAAHLVACWNACEDAGISNPEAVPGMMAAAERLVGNTDYEDGTALACTLDVEALQREIAQANRRDFDHPLQDKKGT